MPRHIALLRGINVGGHRVKMDRLRELFTEMGFEDVSTFIASGNVIFAAAETDVEALADRIERHLGEALGFPVETFLRSPERLVEIVEFQPPEHREGRALYVIFLKGPPDASMRARFAEVESEADRFTFADREIYWSIDGKISESPLFGGGFDRAMAKTSSTARNTTSLRRLVAKLGS